jgi:hypothetical protein
VPLCVLRGQMMHKLPVQRPCRVEVHMSERRVQGGAPEAPH